MKKKIKTYGAHGYVEWMACLKVGRASLSVNFTGGSITTQGVIPASYTTDNSMIQTMIEHSDEYASGKIRLVRQCDSSEDLVVMSNKRGACPADSQVVTKEADEKASENASESSALKVSGLREAASYLHDHHGIALRKLTTQAAVDAAAEQFGVKFEYSE